MRYEIDYAHPTYIERTAVHESGHALVVTRSSLLPPVTSVCLNEGGGGFCMVDVEKIDPRHDRGRAVRQGIRACAAGMMAELLAFGSLARPPFARGANGEERDAHKMVRLAEMLDPSERQGAYSELDVAEFLLRSSWGAVDFIARRLLECGSLPGHHVRHLIATAPEATKFPASTEAAIGLMSRAGSADPGLGAAILRALRKAA